MEVEADKSGIVIVVEDDPYSLDFMESSLRRAGYTVKSAVSTAKAREAIQQVGLENVQAVISDYRLPKETGTEFIRWLLTQDRHLATVIVTAQGEKTVVQETLTAGAIDYLEKPVTHKVIQNCVARAVAHTRQQRKYAADQRGLKALEQLDLLLKGQVDANVAERMEIYYHPLHEVGGDFYNIYDRPGGGLVLLIGDVSGHDFGSGYVSTYFHGMLKGSLAAGAEIQSTLQLFNASLNGSKRMETANFPTRFSLSLAVLEIDADFATGQHWNYGFPPIEVVNRHGFVHQGKYGNPPLGWLAEINMQAQRLKFADVEWIYFYTDGIIDYAAQLDIDRFSLLYILFNQHGAVGRLPTEPNDDILSIRFKVNPDKPVKETFEPILSEQYAGSEIEHIDHLQSVWRRSLVFALQDQMGDRLYDLLICVREGMINALVHGCDSASDKFAQLQMSYQKDRQLVRVRIDDPGKGHEFDLQKRVNEIAQGAGTVNRHLGLGIIQHLSDEFGIENRGSSLLFDFYVDPEAAKGN